jgi:hypothetical protein
MISPHPSLVASSPVSTGDHTSVPLSSPHPTVVHQEPLVLGELVQDALEMQMPQVREALIP